jgi:hypothetical protein
MLATTTNRNHPDRTPRTNKISQRVWTPTVAPHQNPKDNNEQEERTPKNVGRQTVKNGDLEEKATLTTTSGQQQLLRNSFSLDYTLNML